jgi:hypothetical protein
MENTEAIDFAEFESAFNDDAAVNQSDSAENTEQTEEVETDAEVSGEEQSENPDDREGDEDQNAEEQPEEDSGKETAAEIFTIKVNKEERSVSREEVISLAQKGADYDRVKEQLNQSRQQNQSLQERLDKTSGAVEILEMLAAAAKVSVDEFAEKLHINYLVKNGKTEGEAREKIRADKAEKQLNAAKAKETAQKTAAEDAQRRAQREVEEFHREFPGVELTEELCNQLMADVQSGMSLSNAYRKQEYAKKAARIAELEKQLAAEKQNKKNRSNSPGSQNDSGGRRSRTPEDEFFAAFES